MLDRRSLSLMNPEFAKGYIQAATECRGVVQKGFRSTPPAGGVKHLIAEHQGWNGALRYVNKNIILVSGMTREPVLESLYAYSDAMVFAHKEPRVFFDPERDVLILEFSREEFLETGYGGVVFRFGRDTASLVGMVIPHVTKRQRPAFDQ